MLDFRARRSRRTRSLSLDQNPPFPSPEELQSKLSEFMKSNFGDKVSFASFAQPERAESGDEAEPPPQPDDSFAFDFLPRDIKAHLDRFVIQQDEAKKVLSIAVCDHYNHVNYLRRLESEDADRARENRVRETKCDPRRPDRRRQNLPDQAHRGADQSAVRESGRDEIQRDRLRRRRRRRSRAGARAESRRRRWPRAVRDHLHRRDRQDRFRQQSSAAATSAAAACRRRC